MLTSLGFIFLFGLLAAHVFNCIKLPQLLGMLLVGIVLGPHAFNVLSPVILDIAVDLRQLALIIILLRVGLALDLRDLKKVGRPAMLMCWLPAMLEVLAVVLLAPPLLGTTRLEAGIIGAVLAAVSPAVIAPRMLHLMACGYGKKKYIPQLLMAGASVDDVFVIVLFTSLLGMAGGGHVSAKSVLQIPVSLSTGVLSGILVGRGLVLWFRKYHLRDSLKVLIMLGVSFLLLAFEHSEVLPFSGLLAVMCIGVVILHDYELLAKRISDKFAKLWLAAEVVLFVLVGAAVDIRYALAAGLMINVLVMSGLAFRMSGVWLSLLGTNLNKHERLFCMLGYIPKATVQAAIGAIPLGMGLPCGQMVLTVAVISILVTAPLGALAMDLSYRKLLADDFQP